MPFSPFSNLPVSRACVYWLIAPALLLFLTLFLGRLHIDRAHLDAGEQNPNNGYTTLATNTIVLSDKL